MKTKIVLLLILVYLWGGCTSNDPAGGVAVKVKGVSNLSAMNGRITAVNIVFNDVLLGVEKLEFEAAEENNHEGDNDDEEGDHDDEEDGTNEGEGDNHDGENDDDDGENDIDDGENDNEEIKFEGAFIVDLIAGTSIPDFGVADVVPGLYEEIEIKLTPILPDSNSVYISFTYTPVGGDAVQVEFSTKKEIEIEIENDDGFQVEANVFNTILVLVDLDKLLSGIDLSLAVVDENGIIKINDSSNTEILNQVLSSFNDSCHGGEDNDHDDDIDED